MAISWQTGEPPCGQELLIEYEWDSRKFHAVAAHNGSFFVDTSTGEDMSRISLLRWSTIDDDRSAMAMGVLERMLRSDADSWVTLDMPQGQFELVRYRVGDDERVDESYAPSLIEAIEKLTADQQAQGATDGQA